MAQTSYFWDGAVTGDAILAPYDDTEFADFLENLAGNFVVPGYLFGGSPNDELHVVEDTTTVGQVIVKAGAALVHGVVYILDEDTTVAIPATAGANPAIYRVILDKDTVNQTVRVGLSQGAPAATPIPPVVASNEMTIAWIWVDGAYNPAADFVVEEDIHDERVFKYIGLESYTHTFENLLSNGQFMGTSRGANAAADGWLEVGAATLSYSSGGGRTSRGKTVQLQGPINTGIQTTVPINVNIDRVYTIRGYIEVDATGLDIEIYGTVLGGASVLLTTKTFNIMNGYPLAGEKITEYIIRVYLEEDTAYDALKIYLKSNSNATNAYTGDMLITPGYVAGNMETARKHEVIWFDVPLTDAAWTSSAKSDGTTNIDLSANFGSMFVEGFLGVICKVACRDSGSAAAASDETSVSLYTYISATVYGGPCGVVSCSGKTNDTWSTGVIWVPIMPGLSAPYLRVAHQASGAGTLDVTIEIIGAIV